MEATVSKYDVGEAWFLEITAKYFSHIHKAKVSKTVNIDPETAKIEKLEKILPNALPNVKLLCCSYGSRDGNQLIYALEDSLIFIYCYDERATSLGIVCISPESAKASTIVDTIAKKIPPAPKLEDNTVGFAIWQMTPDGPRRSIKKVSCPTLEELLPNYSPDNQKELLKLAAMSKPHEKGKVIIWRGPPGTGKTHAIRALAREWSKNHKASIELILDPEKLMSMAGYIHSLAINDHDDDDLDENKGSRLLVIEDAAEMFMKGEARSTAGFSRLLNITDGIIGQGLKTVFLFTANEEIEAIDDAIMRPGRCLQTLEFANLPKDYAKEWFTKKGGNPDRINNDMSLAELYSALNMKEVIEEVVTKERIGF